MAAIYSFHPIRLCKYFFALVANINIYVGALFLDILDIIWIWILQVILFKYISPMLLSHFFEFLFSRGVAKTTAVKT